MGILQSWFKAFCDGRRCPQSTACWVMQDWLSYGPKCRCRSASSLIRRHAGMMQGQSKAERERERLGDMPVSYLKLGMMEHGGLRHGMMSVWRCKYFDILSEPMVEPLNLFYVWRLVRLHPQAMYLAKITQSASRTIQTWWRRTDTNCLVALRLVQRKLGRDLAWGCLEAMDIVNR